jgi:hypothetical protein
VFATHVDNVRWDVFDILADGLKPAALAEERGAADLLPVTRPATAVVGRHRAPLGGAINSASATT